MSRDPRCSGSDPFKFIVLLTVLFALPAGAVDPPSADDILRRAFDNYRAATSNATLAMTVHRPEWERRLSLVSWTRGAEDALVRFVAPAKDAGNASLKIGSETWMFDPKLNQVIKLPASMMAQAWMGSDFSHNDLAKSDQVLEQYTHRIIETRQDGDRLLTRIEAVPKAGAPVVWGKVVIEVRDDNVISEQVFFDQDQKVARKLVTEKVGLLGGRAYPVVLAMYPQDRPGEWTRVETTDARFNISLPAYLFTLSNLQNPRAN